MTTLLSFMRIVSYNILDGGEGRADPLAEIIQAQHPDILALVEADNLDVLDRMTARLGIDRVQAEGNARHSVALASRWPILQTINHAALRSSPRCLLEAVVAEPSGPDWVVGVVHLPPYATEADESAREQEVAALLDSFEPHRRANRPHLLAGDFNANSPIQRIDPERCSPRTRQAWQDNGGHIPRRAIQKILDAGYADSFHAVHGAAAATMATFTTLYPGQRVDYIFAFGIDPSHLRRAWIEQDRLARFASDHFPIGLEIED